MALHTEFNCQNQYLSEKLDSGVDRLNRTTARRCDKLNDPHHGPNVEFQLSLADSHRLDSSPVFGSQQRSRPAFRWPVGTLTPSEFVSRNRTTKPICDDFNPCRTGRYRRTHQIAFRAPGWTIRIRSAIDAHAGVLHHSLVPMAGHFRSRIASIIPAKARWFTFDSATDPCGSAIYCDSGGWLARVTNHSNKAVIPTSSASTGSHTSSRLSSKTE